LSIKIRDIYKHNPGIVNVYKSILGLDSKVIGDDLHFDGKDIKDVLPNLIEFSQNSPTKLDSVNLKAFSEQISNSFESHEEKFTSQIDPPKEILIDFGLGYISHLSKIRQEIFFNKGRGLEKSIYKAIRYLKCTFAIKEGFSYLCKLEEYQRMLSILKLSYLGQRISIVSNKEKIIDNRIYNSIFPPAIDLTWLPYGFFNFSPFLYCYNFRRYGCGLALWGDTRHRFPLEASSSIQYQISHSPGPLTGETEFIPLGTSRIQGKALKEFVHLVFDSTNNLWQVLLDPNHYLDQNGYLDLYTQVRLISTMNQISADLNSMASNVDKYSRLTFCLSIVDKISNIRHFLKGMRTHGPEKLEFIEFFSEKSEERVTSILKHHIKRKESDLCHIMTEHLGKVRLSMADSISCTPKQLGERVKTIRDLRHGHFIVPKRVEELYDSGEVRVSGDFADMIYLNILALMLDPKRYLFPKK